MADDTERRAKGPVETTVREEVITDPHRLAEIAFNSFDTFIPADYSNISSEILQSPNADNWSRVLEKMDEIDTKAAELNKGVRLLGCGLYLVERGVPVPLVDAGDPPRTIFDQRKVAESYDRVNIGQPVKKETEYVADKKSLLEDPIRGFAYTLRQVFENSVVQDLNYVSGMGQLVTLDRASGFTDKTGTYVTQIGNYFDHSKGVVEQIRQLFGVLSTKGIPNPVQIQEINRKGSQGFIDFLEATLKGK